MSLPATFFSGARIISHGPAATPRRTPASGRAVQGARGPHLAPYGHGRPAPLRRGCGRFTAGTVYMEIRGAAGRMAAGKVEWTERDTEAVLEFDKWYHSTAEKRSFRDFGEFARWLNWDGPAKGA